MVQFQGMFPSKLNVLSAINGVGNLLNRIGNRGTTNPVKDSTPLLNEVLDNVRSFFNTRSQLNKKKSLMEWYKTQPELTGIVNKVARDIVGEFHFENLNPNETDESKIIKANEFAQQIRYRALKYSQTIDKLVTGESFAWLGALTDKQVKTAIKKSLDSRPFIGKQEKKTIRNNIFKELKLTTDLGSFSGTDEDVFLPKEYRYVASSTVETVFDSFNILGYKQVVASKQIFYEPHEMIRSTFMNVDGKVTGFTPVSAVLEQLQLVRFMWNNMTAFEQNGAKLNKIFIAEDKRTTDPDYLEMRKQLKSMKNVKNGQASLFLTGKIKVEELQNLENMQFMDMGLYIMSIFALQWQVPRSSYAPVVGGSNSKDDTGGNAEKAYWENIEFAQDTDADIENNQLWIPHFGVKLVYEKNYIQKDVQKQTAKGLKLQNIKSANEILAVHGETLSKEKTLSLLELCDNDTEELPEQETEVENGNNPKQLSDSEVNDSSVTADKRNKKKQEQASTQGAVMKPTGTGKILKFQKFDNSAEMEYKEMIGIAEQIVPFDMFVKLYKEDDARHLGKSPRVFVRANEEFTTFKFKSEDFIYKSTIESNELEGQRVAMMNFGNHIFRL